MTRTVLDRMDEALYALAQKWPKRRAKAFYLCAPDWDEFRAHADVACTVTVMVGNNPPVPRTDPAFQGVPVRPSDTTRGVSRLYDDTTTGRDLPK